MRVAVLFGLELHLQVALGLDSTGRELVRHQALLLEVLDGLQNGEIILGRVVENEPLRERHLAAVGLLVLQSLRAHLLIMHEAALALLAACAPGRKVLAVTLKLCFGGLRDLHGARAAGRHGLGFRVRARRVTRVIIAHLTTRVVALITILTLALGARHGVVDLPLRLLKFSSQLLGPPLLPLEFRLLLLDVLLGIPSLLPTVASLLLGSFSTSFRRESAPPLCEPRIQIGWQPISG